MLSEAMLACAGVINLSPAANSTEIEEVVVTGSRIPDALGASGGPIVMIDRSDVRRLGTESLGQVLQQLPMNSGSPANTNENAAREDRGGDGSTRVDLRGLGPARSLVLVNGRRFVYGGVGGDTSADLNMIPSSTLERVEVMGVGSSTVYGSDAIGGVVNFIAREDFDGAQLDLSYTWAEQGDGTVGNARFFAGQTSERGYLTFGDWAALSEAICTSSRFLPR